MTARFVPAVDYDGDTVWLDPHGRVVFLHATETPGADWRRLGWEQDGEHSDPHLVRGRCRCSCPKCVDDVTCICPECISHRARRAVTT